MQCRLHELRHKRRISVAAASKILSNLVYSYKGMGLSMGTMCAGVTPQEGPALYYIDSDGTRLAGNLFCVGSGQTFAYGVLDAEYHYDLTEEDALELGQRSILAATHRDAFSGGFINLYHVKEDGWVKHGFNVSFPVGAFARSYSLTSYPGYQPNILEDQVGKGGILERDIRAGIGFIPLLETTHSIPGRTTSTVISRHTVVLVEGSPYCIRGGGKWIRPAFHVASM